MVETRQEDVGKGLNSFIQFTTKRRWLNVSKTEGQTVIIMSISKCSDALATAPNTCETTDYLYYAHWILDSRR